MYRKFCLFPAGAMLRLLKRSLKSTFSAFDLSYRIKADGRSKSERKSPIALPFAQGSAAAERI